MKNLSPRSTKSHFSLFLASPSDLAEERRKIAAALGIRNSNATQTGEPVFILNDGFSTGPGLGRAQTEINKLLRESDFCIVLFKEKWGSNPDKQGPYSSGTEEEFFTSLLSILDDTSPMQNSVVFFVQCQNPEERVTKFKNELRSSFQVFYGETTSGELEKKVLDQLTLFMKRPAPDVPDRLKTSTGVNVVSPQKKLVEGRKAFSMGDLEKARALFEKAAVEGSVVHKAELAKFYRRLGDFSSALKILDEECWPTIPEQFPYSSIEAALVLIEFANIDLNRSKAYEVILRTAKHLNDLDLGKVESPRQFAELFDCLGRAYYQEGDRRNAREAFENAETLRNPLGDDEQTARSIINLARLDLKENNYASLERLINKGQAIEHRSLNTSTKANLELLNAQYYLQVLDKPTEAEKSAKRALRSNEYDGNDKGIVYSLNLLIQVEIELEKLDEAQANAERGMELSRNSNNEFGINKFKDLLSQVDEHRAKTG